MKPKLTMCQGFLVTVTTGLGRENLRCYTRPTHVTYLSGAACARPVCPFATFPLCVPDLFCVARNSIDETIGTPYPPQVDDFLCKTVVPRYSCARIRMPRPTTHVIRYRAGIINQSGTSTT